MNLRKEYEQYAEALAAIPVGQEILSSLCERTERLATYLITEWKGSDSVLEMISPALVKMAGLFLGQKKIAKIFEENAVLLLGRLRMAAQAFDGLPIDMRVEIAFEFLAGLLHELEASNDRLQLVKTSPHDKKVRKQRRQELLSEDKAFCEGLESAESVCIERCIKLLLPEGGKSLLLPAGAELFLNKIDDFLKGGGSFCKKALKCVLSRERKIDMLCRGYAYLYIWGCKGCPIDPLSKGEVPANLVDAIALNLEKPVQILFPVLSKYAKYIPKEGVARKIGLFFYEKVGNFSLEEGLFRLIQYVLHRQGEDVVYTSRTGDELDSVIGKLCTDEKIPSALIAKFVQMGPQGEEAASPNAPLLESIFHGIRETMSQKISKTILQSVPWQEVFSDLLEEVRFFVLSVHCDKAWVEGISKVADRLCKVIK